MNKYPLLSQLRKNVRLLEHRRDMIPTYVNQPGVWRNGNPYRMDMIPALQWQIDELKAAIRGIEEWKKNNLKSNLESKKQAERAHGLEQSSGSASDTRQETTA
jgi:hypothetical protein